VNGARRAAFPLTNDLVGILCSGIGAKRIGDRCSRHPEGPSEGAPLTRIGPPVGGSSGHRSMTRQFPGLEKCPGKGMGLSITTAGCTFKG
jgi:hypothetical protein